MADEMKVSMSETQSLAAERARLENAALIQQMETMKYAALAKYANLQPPQQIILNKNTAENLGTAEMIMELLKRGYVVMKCPEPGMLPETLRAPSAT